MKNLTLKFSVAAALLGLTLSASRAAMADEKVGTLNVTVLDESGAVVPDAPIYIYGDHKSHFVGGKNIPGTATLTMPAGSYRISSAVIKHNGEYLDRFTSHEAHVNVVEGDNTSIILTLHSIDDPTSSMTYAEVHHIGIPDSVARELSVLN